jgi:hypothetical protein
MFERNRQRQAEITLCLFPHLREFVAIDIRDALPDGPAVRLISVASVYTNEFLSRVEQGFSALLRKEGIGLLDMMGMPQEVEVLIRSEAMKKIVRELNLAGGLRNSGNINGIGVLFFSRDLLTVSEDQLDEAMRELFGAQLPSRELDRLNSELQRLISEEKLADDSARQGDMARLIRGDGGEFLTIWDNKRSR